MWSVHRHSECVSESLSAPDCELCFSSLCVCVCVCVCVCESQCFGCAEGDKGSFLFVTHTHTHAHTPMPTWFELKPFSLSCWSSPLHSFLLHDGYLSFFVTASFLRLSLESILSLWGFHKFSVYLKAELFLILNWWLLIYLFFSFAWILEVLQL